jgi:sigma-E factor negative regulatory protein RseB
MVIAVPRWLPAAALVMSLWPSAEVRAAAAEPADAGAWLARMHEAAEQRNYRGTMIVSVGAAVSSSRVSHYRVGDQSYEQVEALDGRQHRLYRHNEVVQTLWPQTKEAVIERRGVPGLTGLQPVEPRALERYELRLQGRARVAGRDAQVLLLEPRDEFRFAQRLWADSETGLMLRADVLDARRQVLESSAFSDIEIGIEPKPETVTEPMRRLDGYRIETARSRATRLEAEGWTLGAGLPGFVQTSCALRPLQAGEPGSATVLQAVFSDGLTHVSLFIEPYDADRHGKPLQAQIGATHSLMQRRGAYWITVVGDVPTVSLARLIAGLERRR